MSARDIHISTHSNREELEKYLDRAVASYEARMYAGRRIFSLPAQPYKFLHSFGLEDEPIFFGRQLATDELHRKMLHDRLTVLYAKSGAGKTSLLNAGLSPLLLRQGRLPLYVRVYEDPVLAFKQAIAATGPWPNLLHDLTLHEFLGSVCERLGRQTQELIILLDQFEEFFLKWTQPEARHAFIKDLGTCYEDQGLPLRFIIALRKDYFGDLLELEDASPRLPVSRNRYQLKPMTAEEAQVAITKPLAQLDIALTYEPILLETLMSDLTLSEMELPLLQIICTRLYETRVKDEAQITLKTYEALGQVEGVLASYLNGVLTDRLGRQETLARHVLKELVRSDGMKQLLSDKTLAVRVDAQRDDLNRVLDRLVDARLLRRDEVGGEITYELAHEYLTKEIVKWMNAADQEFKQAEELLERELTNWRVQYLLIPKSHLEVLHKYRERFKGLDAESWQCLVSSALAEDVAIADWVTTSGQIGELILFQVLKTSSEQTRERGIKTLKELSTSGALEPALAALQDADADVRRLAARALGAIRDSRAVEPLSATLRDADDLVRWSAAEALGAIRDSHAVEPLIAALQDADTEVRWQAADALGAIGDPRAVEPLIAALQDASAGVRGKVAEALGAIRDPRVVEPLIAALQDASAGVRWSAARVLGAIGDPYAVEPLMAALRDATIEVREQAADALEAIGAPHAVEP